MKEAASPPLASFLRQRPIQIALVLAVVSRLVIALIPSLPHYTRDSMSYIDPGVNFFSHGTFALTCDPECLPSLVRTPAYPLIVGLLLGPLALPHAAVYVFQALIDALSTLLVAALGGAMGGRKTAVVSAFVHALNPFSAVFAAQIMTESVATLALLGCVYLLFRLRLASSVSPTRGWLALGILLGFATLVRPAFAPIPGVLALAMFERKQWQQLLRGWTIATGGFALIVAPWVIRNWVVTRNGGADDSFRVLASWAVPRYRALSTPGLVLWYQSFEEPFIWDRPREAPITATYLLPGERERTEQLFEGVRAVNLLITPELDAEFDRLAKERIAAHPFRTRVLPPISRAARLWITPRLSSFGIESARLSGLFGKSMLIAATAMNACFALLGFFTGFVLWRSVAARLLLAVPVYLTVAHSIIMWGNQSRYVVPGFPEIAVLAALGSLSSIGYIRRMRTSQGDEGESVPRAEVV